MSDLAMSRGWRRMRHLTAFAALATFAVGLAAAFGGARLLLAKPTPETAPGAAATPPSLAAPVAAAEAAPPTSLADIAHLASVIDRNLALHRLADGLDPAGVERLLAEAGALEREAERDSATRILYARYVDLDPEAALRHALARDAASERGLYDVFEVWADANLAAALRRAETLTAGQRRTAGTAILLARRDLPRDARVEIAARLSPQGDLQDIVAQEHFADDPAHAWRDVLAWQPGQARNYALHRVANRWARTDPRTALADIGSAAGVDARTRAELRQSVARQWAQADPRAALDWLAARPASQARGDLIHSALMAWADADPRAVAAWLDVPENRAMTDGWQHSLGERYAARHPDEAVDWLLTRPWPRDAGRGTLEFVLTFRELAKNDPAHAIRLLRRVEDADARRDAIGGLVSGWAETDPRATMAWMDRQALDPYQYGQLNSVLLQAWARVDGAAAARHIDRLTDQQTRDHTIAGMLEIVLRNDASLAEVLFDRLESEDKRRRAARALYEHLSNTDPERAERYR